MIAILIIRYVKFVSINVNNNKAGQDFKDTKWLKLDSRSSN